MGVDRVDWGGGLMLTLLLWGVVHCSANGFECYVERYADVRLAYCFSHCDWESAKAFYSNSSQQQQQHLECPSVPGEGSLEPVTPLQCYMLENDHVRRACCGACQWEKVKQHYKRHGVKEGRGLECMHRAKLSAATSAVVEDRQASKHSWQSHRPRKTSIVLSFSVCGGLNNQRLALLDALMIGHLLNATVILPELHTCGFCNYDTRVHFTEFFDYNATRAALSPLVHVELSDSPAARRLMDRQPRQKQLKAEVHGRAHTPGWYHKAISAFHDKSSTVLLKLGCTFFSLNKHDDSRLEELFWRMDGALIPATRLVESAQETIKTLQARSVALGGPRSFNALHLRVEPDWIEHCARWESKTSVPVRDNCLTNTDRLDRVFAIEGVDESQALYVATHEEGKGDLQRSKALHNLKLYQAVSKTHLDRNLWFSPFRELSAFHDLLVCDAAAVFVGNSVSTFSAYLELKRARGGRGHADFHYNGGNIPLEEVLFGRNTGMAGRRALKWVFTINSDASPRFVEAALVAVASARKNTKLVAICVHLGPLGHVASLLKHAGVRVIQHEPWWSASISEVAKYSGAVNESSTNYASTNVMVSTMMRFDIPIMGFVDKYLLYTDVDVLFLQNITLDDFLPLPAFYCVGTELLKVSPGFGNAGVMLLNVDTMRRTYNEFMNWTFSEANIRVGLHFGKYGPLDQGAYNRYYRGRFDLRASPLFNWKPYWGYHPAAKLVHFHGPKVSDYISHNAQPSQDRKIFARIFESCDKRKVACYEYVHIWQDYNDTVWKL